MDETIHGTVMPVLELSLQPGESIISEVGEFQLDDRCRPDRHEHRRRHGGGRTQGHRQAGRVRSLHHDEYLHRRGRRGSRVVCGQGARAHHPHRCESRSRVHGPPPRLHGGHPRASSWTWGSSSPFAAASSAAWASSSRRSLGPAVASSISPVRCWLSISNPGRACGCTRATSVSSRPRSPSRWSGCPAWPIATWATTVTTSPS